MGQQKMLPTHAIKLNRVEITCRLDGEEFYHEKDPLIDFFPRLYGIVQSDKPGITTTRIGTPAGELSMRHQVVPAMVEAGTIPYLQEHPIKDEADVRVLEFILSHAEYVQKNDDIEIAQREMGSDGFAVPLMQRIPFQSILLDYVGEVPTFYMLYDNPGLLNRLMDLLDQQMLDVLASLEDLHWPYVEFGDNLEAQITNPKLFRKFSLSAYQRYTEILHNQGKKVGSHTDGNLRPLLRLLVESGLDVCESFTPAPVTECRFEEAWLAWENGPIIWGGIPSSVLEQRVTDDEFVQFVDDFLDTLGSRPIIVGIGDMVMADSLIERVEYISRRIEEHTLA
jgi:hypothetical protein